MQHIGYASWWSIRIVVGKSCDLPLDLLDEFGVSGSLQVNLLLYHWPNLYLYSLSTEYPVCSCSMWQNPLLVGISRHFFHLYRWYECVLALTSGRLTDHLSSCCVLASVATSLASLSAMSFPTMLACSGVQLTSTTVPFSCKAVLFCCISLVASL